MRRQDVGGFRSWGRSVKRDKRGRVGRRLRNHVGCRGLLGRKVIKGDNVDRVVRWGDGGWGSIRGHPHSEVAQGPALEPVQGKGVDPWVQACC